MTSQSYNCPSCAAPLEVEHRFTRTVVCQYCGQTSDVRSDGLDPTGKMPKLADFESILSIGKDVELRGEKGRVLGRLRYEYEDGFWDEWFIALANGRKVWLQEDEGTFTAFEKANITTEIPDFRQIKVGKTLSVNGMSIFVTEKNEAQIKGGEGELGFRFKPGEPVNYIDGNSSGKMVSVEFTDDELHLSTGEDIPVSAIKVSS